MVKRIKTFKIHPKSWMIDKLIKQVGEYFTKIKDPRGSNAHYKLVDCLKGAFAMFSLKDPSLLVFRKNYEQRQSNLQRIYGLGDIPQDTALREAIDGVSPDSFNWLFPKLIETVKAEGIWESRKVLGDYMTVSVDGTGHYCSGKKSCQHCMIKNLKNGKQQFYHQKLAAVQMHPEVKTVFPLGTEAIIRQDGASKNDCEHNAAKRLLPRISSHFGTDSILYVMDALYATGPMIKLIKSLKASFLIGIKEGYVLIQADHLTAKNQLQKAVWSDGKTKGIAKFTNGLILNGKHQDILVNYVAFEQIDIATGKVVYSNSWITDIEITCGNVRQLVKMGRSRWKIENETFNTLKNQGYQLEHNYGHGKEYLATNFAILMFIAFLVEQIAQALCHDFLTAWQFCKSKKQLWEKVRQVFDLLPAKSINAIYRFIAKGRQIDYPLLE